MASLGLEDSMLSVDEPQPRTDLIESDGNVPRSQVPRLLCQDSTLKSEELISGGADNEQVKASGLA